MSENTHINELKADLDTMIGNSSQLKAEKLYAKGWRKQSEGEWETVPDHRLDTLSTYRHRCIECDYFYKDTKPYGHNFCPYCGAKMKGGAE